MGLLRGDIVLTAQKSNEFCAMQHCTANPKAYANPLMFAKLFINLGANAGL